jgi:signal transduction histidine kinase
MTGRRVAWAIWGLTVALLAMWPFLGSASGGLRDELVFYIVVPVAVLAYATVGALITSRHPENRIGLILAGASLAFALSITAGDYTTLAVDRPDSLPFARWVAWLGRLGFALWLAPLPLLFLLYPNGRVVSPRWRPVLWVLLAALGVNISLFAVTPGPMTTGFGERGVAIANPLGLPLAWEAPVEGATELAGLVAVVCAGLAAVSLVLRFRRSRGEERQQIRWLGYVGAVLVAVPLIALLIALVRTLLGVEVSEGGDVVGIVAWLAFFLVLLFGVPAACAIAILRYRLYEIDVVIKKTIVFGILVVLIMVAALGLVLVASGPLSDLVADEALAAGLVGGVLGLLVWPLYRISRRVADRLVYRGRSSSYEVLTEFSGRMSVAYGTENVLPRLAAVLGEGTGATRAVVWLRIGRDLRPEAVWPAGADAPTSPPDDAAPVAHQGEVLGALSVEMPANDPMNPTKAKIVRDLAAQAGLVLRNVALIEDLRAASQRLVAAQDEERRRIERNIHDGAQQQLIALAVKLKMADSLVGKDEERAHAMLADLQTETTRAVEDIRDLARGIYPPLLADKGLGAALESQARKSAVPVSVETGGIGRYPQEAEAAVYFACLEALQNVAKYAEATGATVRLAQANGTLSFEVTDDGRGFDPAGAQHGSGLQGIADRLHALAGELEIESAPGRGTTVRGRIPVKAGEVTR